MATFLNNGAAAAEIVNNDVRGRVDLQISGSGTMPKEDARSNSLGYHLGNMDGFLTLARKPAKTTARRALWQLALLTS